MMTVSIIIVFGIPLLLQLLLPYSKNGIVEKLSYFFERHPLRVGLSLLFQAGLLIYSFAGERIETNRTQRMRLRSAAFVIVIIGLTFMVLNVLPVSVRKDFVLSALSLEREYGFSGLVFFSCLILYNLVFKILQLFVLD